MNNPLSDHKERNRFSRTRREELLTRSARQDRRFFSMFLYLLVLCSLFTFNHSVILQQQRITVAVFGFVLINSLIIAATTLVADNANLRRWRDQKPLIYPILSDAALVALMFIAVHVIEYAVMEVFGGNALSDSVPFSGGNDYLSVISVALILFVSMIPFFAFRHVSRAIDPGKAKMTSFTKVDKGK